MNSRCLISIANDMFHLLPATCLSAQCHKNVRTGDVLRLHFRGIVADLIHHLCLFICILIFVVLVPQNGTIYLIILIVTKESAGHVNLLFSAVLRPQILTEKCRSA